MISVLTIQFFIFLHGYLFGIFSLPFQIKGENKYMVCYISNIIYCVVMGFLTLTTIDMLTIIFVNVSQSLNNMDILYILYLILFNN